MELVKQHQQDLRTATQFRHGAWRVLTEVDLRCAQLANASRVLGNLGRRHPLQDHAEERSGSQEARAAPNAVQDAAPEPKRRGRPPGSKNKPKQDVPTAPKRKPKPPVETTPVEAPAEAPAEPEAPQLTREQQRALRMLERQSAYDRLTTGASVLV